MSDTVTTSSTPTVTPPGKKPLLRRRWVKVTGAITGGGLIAIVAFAVGHGGEHLAARDDAVKPARDDAGQARRLADHQPGFGQGRSGQAADAAPGQRQRSTRPPSSTRSAAAATTTCTGPTSPCRAWCTSRRRAYPPTSASRPTTVMTCSSTTPTSSARAGSGAGTLVYVRRGGVRLPDHHGRGRLDDHRHGHVRTTGSCSRAPPGRLSQLSPFQATQGVGAKAVAGSVLPGPQCPRLPGSLAARRQ